MPHQLPIRPASSILSLCVGAMLCGSLGVLIPRAAHAQVSFTLTYSSAVTPAGSEAFFYGTITNNSASLVYLNNLGLVQDTGTNPSSGGFTTDASPFLNNAPGSLAASGGSYTGQLFGVKTVGTLPVGSQFLGTASLYGGATDSSQNLLALMQNFSAVSSSGLPEPGSIAFLLTGAVVGGGSLVRRRQRLRQVV